jgi:acyl carrier protein
MRTEVLKIINGIREAKGLRPLSEIKECDRLREDLSLTSFDLAELTVKLEDKFDVDVFEDGIVNNIGEIIAKLNA